MPFSLAGFFGKKFLRGKSYSHLSSNVLNVRNFEYLKAALEWDCDPVLDGDYLHSFNYLEDLNGRRLRDAEVIGGACCNGSPKVLLEIGTSHGRTTALMAKNAPEGLVYTVNIPPEEITEGGRYVTFSPSRESIGQYYRAQKCSNVRQIFANTKNWIPDIGTIDVAFIDGCHDADFVYNDTRKILTQCRPGSLLLWHDFNPELALVFPWINDVCRGIDQLYAEGMLAGRVLHLQDSWVGIYKVQDQDCCR